MPKSGIGQASNAKTQHDTVLRPTPDFVWADLRAYEARIVDRSEAMREAWEDGGEGRTVGVRINGDPVNLMAAADFLLGCDETPPVLVNVED